MEVFKVRETNDGNHYTFGITEEYYNRLPNYFAFNGYGVFAARLLGFSYPDLLRYCVSRYEGQIVNTGLSHVIFKDKTKVQLFCNEINSIFERFVKELKGGV